MKKGQKSTPESPVQTAKAHLLRTPKGVFADGTISLNRARGHVPDLFSNNSPKWTYRSARTACRWTEAALQVWCELRWIPKPHEPGCPVLGVPAWCSEGKLPKCCSPGEASSRGRVRARPHDTERESGMRCTIQYGIKRGGGETSELLTPT